MSRLNDLTGQEFGRLFVVKRAENDRYGRARWECRCFCGKITFVSSGNLLTGHTSTCGCGESLNRKQIGSRTKVHGKYGTSIYSVWNSMIQRCTNLNQIAYKNYGGRGIRVCDEWRTFDNFYKWALSSKYDETALHGECTIERIDVNGDYTPINCKWVTMKEQANNRRTNHWLSYRGERKTVSQWANILGLPYSCLSQRINRLGWTVDRALTTSVGCKE